MITPREFVAKYISEKKGILPEDMNDSSRLLEDLSMDSLDRAEMEIKMEDFYKARFPEADMAPLRTLGEYVEYVEEHLPKAS